MAEPTVDLLEFDGVGLILKSPTGLSYTNQVAGGGCFHPCVRGHFVPVPERVGRPEKAALRQFFGGAWHSLAPDSADALERLFRRHPSLATLSVDREELANSFEAWVHVSLDHAPADGKASDAFPFLSGAQGWKGVLTWQNSD